MDSYDAPAPPQIPPPPPPFTPAPRHGNGWMIVSLILFGLLLVVGAVALSSALGGLLSGGHGSSHGRSPELEETWVDHQPSPNKIAVIRVEGPIMGSAPYNMVETIERQFDRAAEDDAVKAVLLQIDSPGGEVLASDEINRAIQIYQDETGNPVVASMGSLAASGGYYVAAPCRWIVANPLTITGSIGVIMSGYNYRGLMDKVGLRPEVYKSGQLKDMLRPSKLEGEITDQERALVQGMVDETYQRFKEVVAKGRAQARERNEANAGDKGRALIESWTSYADGRILSGNQAFEHGFVDELGNLDTAIERTKKLANLENASLIEYRQVFNLGNLLRMFGKAEKTDIRIDLGLDLPRLKNGHLYFLAPTFVP